jgi:Electron transfer DM13
MKLKSLFLLIVLAGCQPDDATPEEPIDDNFDDSGATILKKGTLTGAKGHTASGMVSIFDSMGTKTVVLDPYESQNGPDLKVYLSKSSDASEYINLGQLKSTSGRQSYSVPASVNVNDYKYVLIWCEQFTVLFAEAEMK